MPFESQNPAGLQQDISIPRLRSSRTFAQKSQSVILIAEGVVEIFLFARRNLAIHFRFFTWWDLEKKKEVQRSDDLKCLSEAIALCFLCAVVPDVM